MNGAMCFRSNLFLEDMHLSSWMHALGAEGGANHHAGERPLRAICAHSFLTNTAASASHESTPTCGMSRLYLCPRMGLVGLQTDWLTEFSLDAFELCGQTLQLFGFQVCGSRHLTLLSVHRAQ